MFPPLALTLSRYLKPLSSLFTNPILLKFPILPISYSPHFLLNAHCNNSTFLLHRSVSLTSQLDNQIVRYGSQMNAKVQSRRWAVCVATGICVGFVYFAGTLLLCHRWWYHKMGSAPAISQWLDALGIVLVSFPFGYWTDDANLSLVLNGLLWSAVGTGVCALRFWRARAT